ncbi:GTP binding protein [Culex quinquefasciatus]|uniref:GTP binding protein n=1 Tax=Culex quinquefasciatus TaxID=7176 RepID=B0XKE4_CULQU|nr:GTP binding protein [Culex quinquefasciatus]|eukprot:XP_001870116.1 GTP binding protein [Culex quinquefasciatus]
MKKKVKRSQIRKGMVLVSPEVNPQACWEFDCEILVLHHPTTISSKYGRWSAMVHCGSIRQTAQILQMSKECLRTGDKAVVRFRFIKNPEYMKPGQRMVMLMLEQIFYMLIYVYVYLKVFREGRTKAVGNVITPLYTAGSVQQRSKPNKMQGRMGSAMNQQQMASKPLSKSTNDAALEEQPLGNSEVPVLSSAAAKVKSVLVSVAQVPENRHLGRSGLLGWCYATKKVRARGTEVLEPVENARLYGSLGSALRHQVCVCVPVAQMEKVVAILAWKTEWSPFWRGKLTPVAIGCSSVCACVPVARRKGRHLGKC